MKNEALDEENPGKNEVRKLVNFLSESDAPQSRPGAPKLIQFYEEGNLLG